MGQILHRSATTTEAVRRAVQQSQKSMRALARRHGIHPKTVEQEATHNQLKAHLTDFLRACNFARRLKTLGGLTPYEYLCKLWTQTADRFTLNPIHQIAVLNT